MRAGVIALALLAGACATPASDALREVTIRAHVPEGVGAVYLTGNIDAIGPWDPDAVLMQGEGRERTAHLNLPEGATLEYKFTLGEWAREAADASGAALPNNVLVIDGDEDVTHDIALFKRDPREYFVDWQGSGVIGRLEFWPDTGSRFLETPRHVEIWLPPQYDADPDARFPVIYMHDGQNIIDPRTSNFGVDWGIDETIVALTNEGVIEPAIVVGVWSTDLRRFEYAPAGVLAQVSDEMRAAAANEFPEDLRLGDAYVRFLAEELRPRVDAAFRTRPGRESTFIMGSSMGAIISIYAMAERPDVFSGAAGLSMHWPVGVERENFIDREAEWRPAIADAWRRYFEAKALEPASHRMWVDHGTGFLDHYYTPYQETMLPVLRRLGYVEGQTLEARVYPGADHNEQAWRARLREPITFLLGQRTR